MPRDRDEFEIDVEGFDRRLASQGQVGRTALLLPDGLKPWKPKRADGVSHTVDFLPFKVTDTHLKYVPNLRQSAPGKWYCERTYFGHRGIGVNQDKYICPTKTFGKRCPICESQQELKKSPHKEDEERAKLLRCSERQLWLVWDNDDRDAGVQLWDEANFNFGANIASYIKSSPENIRSEYRAFWSPWDGFTVRLSCREKPIGKFNNYEYHIHSFYKRSKPLPEEIVRHGFDLDAIVVALEYKALKSVFEGMPEEDSDGPVDAGNGDHKSRAGENGHGGQAEKKVSRFADYDDPGPAPANRIKDEPKPEPKREPKAAPPDEEPSITCATGDTVEFDTTDDTLTGVVKRVDPIRMLAFVEVAGIDKQLKVGMEDVRVVQSDTTFDLVPKGKKAADPEPVSKAAARKSKWDDADDDPRSAAPTKPKDEDKPTKRRTRRDDD
jgi:hypothetical protein